MTLQTYFNTIRSGSELLVEIPDLKQVLVQELALPLSKLEPRLNEILPCLLVHYMKNWRGWQKSDLTADNALARFQEYLRFKLNNVIVNEFATALKSMPANNTEVVADDSTQTTNMESEFRMLITCPANCVNTMVFCEEKDCDDIVMAQHGVAPWVQLSTKELLHWPNIQLVFRNSEIHFERNNVHQMNRYLSNSPTTDMAKHNRTIECIDVIREHITRQCYSRDLLSCYFVQLLKLLRHRIAPEQFNEIKDVSNEFLKDIEEININDSMATNSSVVFNIGGTCYARNKKIKRDAQSSTNVCYSEQITPKMQTSLLFFLAVAAGRDPINPQTDFQKICLAEDNFTLVREHVPIIQYHCTFCKTLPLTFKEILIHLTKKHNMEHPVMCFKCKQQFDIRSISQNRWYHQCK